MCSRTQRVDDPGSQREADEHEEPAERSHAPGHLAVGPLGLREDLLQEQSAVSGRPGGTNGGRRRDQENLCGQLLQVQQVQSAPCLGPVRRQLISRLLGHDTHLDENIYKEFHKLSQQYFTIFHKLM